MAKIENIRWLSGFFHGLGAFAVNQDRKTLYGLINAAGETILPCEYRYIDIGDTLDNIAVCKDGEWYYINSRSERVLL